MTDYLTVDDLHLIASGVLMEVVVRDWGLLESAAVRPRTTVFGQDAYPRFVDQAAALLHSLARNHPLVDGNKRLAWAGMRAFCLLNGRDVSYESVDVAEAFVLEVAAGSLDVPEIAAWLAARMSGDVA